MIDRKWIGHVSAPSELALDRGRLRFFAEAIGETDPVYTDVEVAQAAGYADLPAPPTFLFAAEMDSGAVMQTLTDLGIPLARLLHGEQGFTYHKPACAGDVITVVSRIADIYDKKGGALEFVVKQAEARNQAGELVAELRTSFVCRN
ncbi:MaoC family dehydratase N-terminal domain-containing protein [Zavarzinia aquatilis]|uniref:MaoC family dehydratase n=1 Tax=Zavarzinia aquatilis TaxID=2211142 RepID=A0A317DZ58_9PROT|nr:MaoC family dehydratase N-terminal domain-containing protein [Zavarzinia aquatilis]PWR18175.1 MaoC family dehydratase [Zavarzinia aquatilis]